MTTFIPLDTSRAPPPAPAFLKSSSDPDKHLQAVTKAILKARRIAVVCGAGISVQAGIPDFRSPEGLFQTLKRENPKEQLNSGKDLFDASVFSSESTTSIFCQMMGQLSDISQAALPTPFHELLKALDECGKLLRVYTQNIDALEDKCGLTYGVPEFEDRRRSPKAKQTAASQLPTPSNNPTSTELAYAPVGGTVVAAAAPVTSTSSSVVQQQTRLPTPPAEVPRCIPLHGTLKAFHCLNCAAHTFESEPELVRELRAGRLPICGECEAIDATRTLVGKRSRGIGLLRPSVVLYNEPHAGGERVGEAVRRDALTRRGADLLLVVGTSLKVPGTKRVVRELARAVRGPPRSASGDELPTPTPSPRASPPPSQREGAQPPRTIFLNLDFPAPTREWEGVFDVWLSGDAQTFARLMRDAMARDEFQRRRAEERRREREAEAARAPPPAEKKPPKKRKGEDAAAPAAKRPKKAAGAREPGARAQPAARKRPDATKAPSTRQPLRPHENRAKCVPAGPLKIRLPAPAQRTLSGGALAAPGSGLVPEVLLSARAFAGVPAGADAPPPEPPLSPLTPPDSPLFYGAVAVPVPRMAAQMSVDARQYTLEQVVSRAASVCADDGQRQEPRRSQRTRRP